MAALVVTAGASVEQVTPGQDHRPILEVEIEALDKSLVLVSDGIGRFTLHKEREIPCFLRPQGWANQ